MKALILPERFTHLEKVDNLVAGWDTVKLAIRPECRDDRAIDKARVAVENGLNDAAINYFWNMAIYDLYKKVNTYGIEYFGSAISWDGKPLKTMDDLREVKDHQIIAGCFALGIIADEAHFFLEQCREIRNNFSTAHYPMGEIDKFETFNFIKNCIKYVLTFDLPAPGLQIKDLVESLSVGQLEDTSDVFAIIESQASKIHGAILYNLFTNFIAQDCPPDLKHNIKLIAPPLWDLVSDEVKGNIGAKFGSLKEMKGREAANEALEFLKLVNGVEYIPETFKDIIFKKHSQFLIEAHFGWDNFSNEIGYAADLALLGNKVPVTAIYAYVKAITLSFVGNRYGVSRGAIQYDTDMLNELSQTGIKTLFQLLRSDIDVVREVSDYKPAGRLQLLLNLIKDKTMLPKQKEDFDLYTSMDASKLAHHFNTQYWNLVRKK